VRAALLLLVVSLAGATPAMAQIYSWRDAQGTLVLSDRPRADHGEMQTYAVPGSAGLLATRPLALNARSAVYDDIIRTEAARHGLAPDLVRAVIQVESAFDPNAVSPKGAMGLMQIMPATARDFGVRNPFHPQQNIGAGTAYLKQLLDRYDQKLDLALAAYNAGPGNVEKYGDVPPFRETQNYVKKVTGGAAPAGSGSTIYKWIEITDGRPVIRYSNKPPASGPYEIVGRR
jgi:soluble lytic murein transglycosylase-like protein